jgi:GNAT superfamily N-acetyltransferase
LLGIYRRMRLRGRGIGSRILGRVLTEAEAIGAAEVWGSVVPSDIDRSPLLLQWYERHGFVITNPDHVCIPAAVKKISRQIESLDLPTFSGRST